MPPALACSVMSNGVAPDDLIRLRLGDVVPADARLLQGDPIDVDQSALTGESLPVTHKTGETVYSGSIVKHGEIEALVEATGKGTYFGKTTRLVEEASPVSHFQKAVLKIGDYLIVIATALVMLIPAVALFRGDKMMTTLQFALVLTVAAIPVAMPAVLSVTMAVGARLLATKQAIVSRLASIEELAGMDVLCSDKTGTLTQNKLTLGEPFYLPAASAEEVILSGALASRAENKDPIGWGWALLVWGYALAWFFFNDRVKLFAYRLFEANHSEILTKWGGIRDPHLRLINSTWSASFFGGVSPSQARFPGLLDRLNTVCFGSAGWLALIPNISPGGRT